MIINIIPVGAPGGTAPPLSSVGCGRGRFPPLPPPLITPMPPTLFFLHSKISGAGQVGGGGGANANRPRSVDTGGGGHVKNYHFIFHKLLWQQI